MREYEKGEYADFEMLAVNNKVFHFSLTSGNTSLQLPGHKSQKKSMLIVLEHKLLKVKCYKKRTQCSASSNSKSQVNPLSKEIWWKKRKSAASQSFFSSTVGQKWLTNEMAEDLKKLTGTVECEKANSTHSKNNFRQKLVSSTPPSPCPGENFWDIFWKI